MRTRLMALERELQRREKLLRQMLLLNKAGAGIGMDIIEKLREERNMLPIYRRKAQDLQAQIEEKDADIRNLKRDPQFTRIIELQVDFASWQHEAKRLEGLLQDPNPDSNDAARREVEVHERRVEALKEQLEKAKEKRESVAEELEDMKVDHARWDDEYTKSEQQLKEQQENTRELAVTFKKQLQRKKQAEVLDEEIQQMALNKARYEEELSRYRAADASASVSSSGAKRRVITQAALVGPMPTLAPADATRLWALRRAASRLSGEDSLFARFLAHEDSEGFITEQQLVSILGAAGCPHPAHEVAVSIIRWLPAGVPTTHPTGDGGSAVRWLDVLVALDRLGGVGGPKPPPVAPLPDMRSLRVVCLRTRTYSEELQRRLLGATTRDQAEALFVGTLGLGVADVSAWMQAWVDHGPAGLLLRLPLSEATMPEAAHAAWFCRCSDALRAHKRELVDGFAIWKGERLTFENFRMVMQDVVGAELSEEDIEDLALLTGDADGVDTKEVLKLA